MAKSNATLLVHRLKTLLSERQTLRKLLVRYRTFVDTRRYDAERGHLEEEIASLVTVALPESKYRYPQPGHISQCAYSLCSNQVWDCSLVPGVMTDNWAPALKQRLLGLCTPLDEPLERILAL